VGLRTLVIAYRPVEEAEYTEWKAQYDEASRALTDRESKLEAVAAPLETRLHLLGATAIEDKLQDQVPETIADLQKAGIKVWVLTGDKTETAINIGYSCALIKPGQTLLKLEQANFGRLRAKILRYLSRLESQEKLDQARRTESSAPATPSDVDRSSDYSRLPGDDSKSKGQMHLKALRLRGLSDAVAPNNSTKYALVITGEALSVILEDQDLTFLLLRLASACASAIACRVSPLQKARLVRMVKHGFLTAPVTLAIGDGANDVGMIMEADVGIGISGREGMQAVNASDVSIAQFRFLKRLLLVHGRWNYRRICKVVVYSFYKNFCITLVLFYYTFSTGYSGTSLFEELLYTGFNLFTFFPIIGVGFMDQDVSPKTAERFPALYVSGRLGLDLNIAVVVEAIVLAVVHSTIVFLWPVAAYQGLEQSDLNGLFTFGTTVFSCLFFAMQGRVMMLTSSWTTIAVYFQLFSFFSYFLFLVVYSQLYSWSPDFYGLCSHILSQPMFWVVVSGVPASALSVDLLVNYIKREFFPDLLDMAIEVTREFCRP
jgi:phospholipid-transporting ATPase